MNKQALTEVLERALQTLEESFTRERGLDYGVCGQIRKAYYDLYPGERIFDEKDDLPFHLDHLPPTIIMEYLRWRYSIDKAMGVFWWPIAQYSWQLSKPWASAARQERVNFLKTAIQDLKEDL